MSYDQSKAQLAVWAVIAAPFLISNDLRKITPEIKELLLNREIIAVDQDPMGIQGKRVNQGNGIEAWARPVTPVINDEYSYAVAFVSRRTDGHPHPFNYTLTELNLSNKNGYEVKDLFDSKRATFVVRQDEAVEERVNPTGANFYKFTPLKSNSLKN